MCLLFFRVAFFRLHAYFANTELKLISYMKQEKFWLLMMKSQRKWPRHTQVLARSHVQPCFIRFKPFWVFYLFITLNMHCECVCRYICKFETNKNISIEKQCNSAKNSSQERRRNSLEFDAHGYVRIKKRSEGIINLT